MSSLYIVQVNSVTVDEQQWLQSTITFLEYHIHCKDITQLTLEDAWKCVDWRNRLTALINQFEGICGGPVLMGLIDVYIWQKNNS